MIKKAFITFLLLASIASIITCFLACVPYDVFILLASGIIAGASACELKNCVQNQENLEEKRFNKILQANKQKTWNCLRSNREELTPSSDNILWDPTDEQVAALEKKYKEPVK